MNLRFRQKLFYHLFLKWLRYIFSIQIFDLGKESVKRISRDKPIIVVANHQSKWDPFLLFSCMDRNIFFNRVPWRLPVFHGIYKIFFNRWFFKFIGCYPIQPMGDLEKSLSTTFEILEKGQSSIFFPEGKRVSKSKNDPAPPKKGIGLILEKKSVYLLPAHIEYRRFGKRGFGSVLGGVEIVFGEIMESDFFVKNYSNNRHEAVMKEVFELKERKQTVLG